MNDDGHEQGGRGTRLDPLDSSWSLSVIPLSGRTVVAIVTGTSSPRPSASPGSLSTVPDVGDTPTELTCARRPLARGRLQLAKVYFVLPPGTGTFVGRSNVG